MDMRLYDPARGRVEEIRPAEPPVLVLACAAAPAPGLPALRHAALHRSLARAAAYLGLRLAEDPRASRPDLACGPGAGRRLVEGPAACEGGADPGQAAARGFAPEDLAFLFLRCSYRAPLSFSWEALARARDERHALAGAAARLERLGGTAPNPAGLAGYKKRLRDALAEDLDTPRALAVLWEGLRPGALSPGSQRGLLKDAEEALGLGPGLALTPPGGAVILHDRKEGT